MLKIFSLPGGGAGARRRFSSSSPAVGFPLPQQDARRSKSGAGRDVECDVNEEGLVRHQRVRRDVTPEETELAIVEKRH